ncbi:DUF3060 domain-containing protein [Mycolicibacterium peregrinum]|uniref:DUF3060 domain-containing protein n=1 Tax=Mycolicibacterium peregrinum TaxID=43304 RepID=A0A4Z0HUF4_MYCPR|nr:DUF3060 domain-containing protein [Mycolicibacterium peregrinum]TGB44565.1 DUF3060 domain-containing protein [Mycolicibacterium peregrinum]TGB47024.1 DUF3060 domain-containing protein [Mycolicibacterium peregrinum]
MNWTAVGRTVIAGLVALPLALTVGAPGAAAKNGDTTVTGQSLEQTIDCNNATLLVNGSNNRVNALGTCWAITVQGTSNVIVADNVINDITVYGWDQTVFFKNGDPIIVDRGRELAMVNQISRVPA